MKKVFLIVLIVVILTFVYFANYRDRMSFSGLAIGIKIEQYPTAHNLTILQGESEITRIYLENLKDEELIFIDFHYDKPDDISITSEPEYTILEPKSRVPVVLTFTVGDDAENKTHEIKVWTKSGEDASGNSYESEKYSIYVTVLYNPSIIRLSTTTTITTTSITTTILEEENNWFVAKKKYLIIIIALIIMIILLFAIPHFTFRESPEDKEIK